MSRIVRGSTDEVRRMETRPAATPTAENYLRPEFRALRSSDVLSLAEVDVRLKEASQKARTEGAQLAEQKSRAQVQGALENLEGILDELSRFRRELFRECENDIIDLVKRVSRKVLSVELQMHPELFSKIIDQAVDYLSKEKSIILYLNPQDLQTIENYLPGYREKMLADHGVTIRVDAKIPKANGYARTEKQQLDLSFDQMVDHLVSSAQSKVEEPKEVGDEGDKVQ